MNKTIKTIVHIIIKTKQETWCSNCSAGSVCLCHKIQQKTNKQQNNGNFMLEVKT